VNGFGAIVEAKIADARRLGRAQGQITPGMARLSLNSR
jgi:hypothetical protein